MSDVPINWFRESRNCGRRACTGRPVDVRRVLDLGPRETELLSVLWRYGASTVNEIYEAEFSASVTVNTVHSTLERLYRKGFVERSKEGGRSYKYRPIVEQSELIAYCIHAVSDRLAGNRHQMIDGMADFLCGRNLELRDWLRSAMVQCLRQADRKAHPDN